MSFFSTCRRIVCAGFFKCRPELPINTWKTKQKLWRGGVKRGKTHQVFRQSGRETPRRLDAGGPREPTDRPGGISCGKAAAGRDRLLSGGHHHPEAGTTRARLENERLAKEVELVQAKTEAYKSGVRMDELYEKAMAAFKRYSGQEEDEDEY